MRRRAVLILAKLPRLISRRVAVALTGGVCALITALPGGAGGGLPSLPVAAAAPSPRLPTLETFDSAAAALRRVVGDPPPRVLALGELHQIAGGPPVPSSLSRFTRELLPELLPRASDLVVETWVTEGRCGAEEQQAVAQVEETTQRPATTENEVVALLRQAKEGGLAPHILRVTCADYRRLLDARGEMDPVALLDTITRLLEREIVAALARPGRDRRRAVLAYGGAAHTELQPIPALRRFSYAPSVQRKTRGGLVALDLFVPEYLERNDDLRRKPWYRLLARVPAGKTALIHRGPASWVLVFARTAVAPPPGPPASAEAAGRSGEPGANADGGPAP